MTAWVALRTVFLSRELMLICSCYTMIKTLLLLSDLHTLHLISLYKNIVLRNGNITWLIILFILSVPPVCLLNNIDMKARRLSILITHTLGGVFNMCSVSLLCQLYCVIEYFFKKWHVFLCAYCLIFIHNFKTQQQFVWTCCFYSYHF